MLRIQTAGEADGEGLRGIASGPPPGAAPGPPFRDRALRPRRERPRRRAGYGRGGRMKIGRDEVQILSGVRHGKTIGAPVTLQIENKDWTHWEDALPVEDAPGAAEKQSRLP